VQVEKKFNWKIFFVSSMFFFVVLLNLRDFPINNIPLIYPTFLLIAALIGPRSIIEGFRRTKFLSILLIILWIYFRILGLVKGGAAIDLETFAYLLEPLLIFGVAGATGILPGGTKAAIWALVFAITLSTAFGIWIYFIGEPVLSWRTTIHTSIGGNLLVGEILREGDLNQIEMAIIFPRNAGLSYSVFTFSYQLAAALSMILAGFLFFKRGFKLNLVLVGTFIILFVGMITNTQRATLISVPIGLLSFFLIRKRGKKRRKKIIFTFLIIISVIFLTISYQYSKWEMDALFERSFSKEKIALRLNMVIPSIVSVFYEPFGAISLSSYYDKVALRMGWINPDGVASSPHNHFACIILDAGIVGICLIILLFRKLWVKIKYVRSPVLGDEMIILVIGCVTCIIHSLFHNAGFFKGDFSTQIVFGMLWGATPIIRNFSQIKRANHPKLLSK